MDPKVRTTKNPNREVDRIKSILGNLERLASNEVDPGVRKELLERRAWWQRALQANQQKEVEK